MAIVDEMYSEKDSLKTVIEWTDSIYVATGRDWCSESNWYALMDGELASYARQTGDFDVYVFLTGSNATSDYLGLANLGTICDSDKGLRININRYGPEGQIKGKDAYTAEVCDALSYY